MSKILNDKLTNEAVNLFLRRIGVAEYSSNLIKDLSHYIEKKMETLGCCVLWFKALDNPQSPLSILLNKYSIKPTYKKFSIVINTNSILFSKDVDSSMHLVYKDENVTSNYKYEGSAFNTLV